MYFSSTDFDEKCSKEDDWDVDMSGYYDSGMINYAYSECKVWPPSLIPRLIHFHEKEPGYEANGIPNSQNASCINRKYHNTR